MENIVLVTFDSLRADHCSYMGYDRETTPNLDEMAEDGIVFKNAISPASRTNPSMAATFTGEPMAFREKVSNPEISRRHLKRYGTLAQELSEMGYRTCAFNPNAYASRYYGFDIGFDEFKDFFFTTDRYQNLFEKHLSDSSIYGALRNLRNFVLREEVFRTWESYIDGVEDWVTGQDEPFFLWIFSLETHFPHLTPRGHREYSNLFDQYYYNWKCNQMIDEFDLDVTEGTWEKVVDIYDDSIRFADTLLGELADRLTEFDPTFIIHGDHGESFGEHGLYGHFYPSVYDENLHVPMVVYGPETDPETYDHSFSLVDLPELVMDVAGTGSYTLDSRDGNECVFATDYDGRNGRNLSAIRTERWKYIVTRWDEGSVDRELYNLKSNPAEQTNLIENADVARIAETLDQVEQLYFNYEKEKVSIREGVTSMITQTNSL